MSCYTSITTQPPTLPYYYIVTLCPIVKLNKADSPTIAKHRLILSDLIRSPAFESPWALFSTSAHLLCSSFENTFYDLMKTRASRHREGEGGMIVSSRGKQVTENALDSNYVGCVQ
jgi:hypothetical protein